MNILVLCTGNSARSILLEAILNCLGKGRLKVYSAGSKPIGTVNPYSIELLKKKGITKKFSSKSWTTFSTNSEITMDIVITVCGNARDEECPHWGVPDPAYINGSSSEKEIAFSKVYNILEKRAKAFLDLEFENMKSNTLQKNINNISRIV